MEIKKAELLRIAVEPERYPPPGPPEIAFAGRSNVGKSSLLNLLTNQKKLARISGSPGKTQTINFYSINNDIFRIVDLPGYGYARVSKSVSEKWGDMVETYLTGRETLKAVCLLVDIRHDPTEQDKQMYGYLEHYGIKSVIVATKSDKVSANGRLKQITAIRKAFGTLESDSILCVSVLKRAGVKELLSVMGNLIGD